MDYYAELNGFQFLGRSPSGALQWVCLRDLGNGRPTGSMFRTEAEASAAAEQPPGPFDGPLIGIAPLRVISADEAERIALTLTVDPEGYRAAAALRRRSARKV